MPATPTTDLFKEIQDNKQLVNILHKISSIADCGSYSEYTREELLIKVERIQKLMDEAQKIKTQ